MLRAFRNFFLKPAPLVGLFSFLLWGIGLGGVAFQANAHQITGRAVSASPVAGALSADRLTPVLAGSHDSVVAAPPVVPHHVTVGIVESAPLAFFDTPSSSYKGIGVDIFKEIATLLKMTYTFVPLSMDAASDALNTKKVDLIIGPFNAHEATALGTASVPYFYSGLSIASRSVQATYWQAFQKMITSLTFLAPFMYLLAILLLLGVIYSLIQRFYEGQKKDVPQSIWEGFSWATIAFSTIDMPVTKGNLALLFCTIIALFVTIAGSIITATVTSSLTLEQMHPFITQSSDLRTVIVGAKKDSDGAQYLATKAIPFRSFGSLKEALAAAVLGETQATVDDEIFLRYELKQLNVYSLSMLPLNLTRNGYVVMFPQSPTLWMPTFNKALSTLVSNALSLKAIATPYVGYVPHLDQN